jgi:hypothetical protein
MKNRVYEYLIGLQLNVQNNSCATMFIPSNINNLKIKCNIRNSWSVIVITVNEKVDLM